MATKSKAEFVYQALLAANGGVLTPDSAAKYGEAEVFFAMAANYVQIGNYWTEKKEDGGHPVNGMLFSVFDNIPISVDASTKMSYSDLPARVVILPKGRGLRMTTELGQIIIPLPQGDEVMMEYYCGFDGVLRYQLVGQRVWYYNIDKFPLLSSVRASFIADVASLADTAVISLPADGEAKVFELMVGWLTGEIQKPKDYVENGKAARQ